MTTEEKIIAKAIGNGWESIPNLIFHPTQGLVVQEREGFIPVSINDIIFNHDFAKAFFENKPEYEIKDYPDEKAVRCVVATLKNWQHHLQIMILEKDPLKYLEKFL